MLTPEQVDKAYRDVWSKAPHASRLTVFARVIEIEVRKDLEATHQQAIEAAVLAEREAIAQFCHNYAEELGTRNGRTLAPFPHEWQGLHAGMTYAKYIRARTQPMRTDDAHKEDADGS